MPVATNKQTMWRRMLPWLCLLFAGLCVRGLYDAGIKHGGYEFAFGWGVISIHDNEIFHAIWYLVFGVPAVVALAYAFAAWNIGRRLESLRRLFSRRAFVLATTGLALVLSLCVYHFVLLDGAQITDDEGTYIFEAQTLLQGRLVNPPEELDFFHNQFVILNDKQWYGKYPIGHPMVLAIGEAVDLRFLMMPLCTALSLMLTFLVGRKLFGDLEAGIGTCLLLLSPHFIFTGATQLSQPTTMLMMMLGLWGMLKLGEQPKLIWALVAGAAWGFGILARPLPGVPFLVAAFVAFVFGATRAQWRSEWKGKVVLLVVATVPVVAFGLVLLWVNWVQTGNPFESGYQTFHGGLGLTAAAVPDGRVAVSVGGALLRQNFWQFGWPLSLIFVPFARGRRSLLLFWGLIIAEYSYRVISPKTVVSTTGPIYVTEIVPLLALATASGMVQVKRWLVEHGIKEGKRWVVATVLASFVVGALMFLPVQIKNIHGSCKAWKTPYRLLEKVGVKRALVFSMHMVPFFKSWAYYPPNPSPTLDEDVIFVRPPSKPDQIRKAVAFWQRRFPDRRAFTYYHEGDKPIMAELKKPTKAQLEKIGK